AAVTSGRRSGSGKVVFIEFYDDLTKLWGGSPSTEPLTFGVDLQNINNNDKTSGTSGRRDASQLGSLDIQQKAEDSESDMDDNNSIKKLEVVSNVPNLIDNKRKSLEKRLSAAQRDQKLIEAAKEDTAMRKDMLEWPISFGSGHNQPVSYPNPDDQENPLFELN
ncbi:Hypothetical predicted protein, partial [Paramuricea clavata]